MRESSRPTRLRPFATYLMSWSDRQRKGGRDAAAPVRGARADTPGLRTPARGMKMSLLFEQLNVPLAHRLGWTLVHFVWQGVFVGLLAAVVFPLVRHRSSATRYNTRLALFAALAVCPLATFAIVGPGAEPARSVAREMESLEAGVASDPAPRWPHIATASQDGEDTRAAAKFAADAGPAVGGQPNTRSKPGVAGAKSLATPPSETATGYAPSMQRSIATALPWMILLWSAGVLTLAARLGRSWWLLQRLMETRTEPLREPWAARVGRLRGLIGVRRATGFLESPAARVPMVIGWLRPVVLMPTTVMTGLRPEEIESLLLHELAHIRRFDEQIHLAQTVVETLLFYHPVVGWLSRDLRREREHCCDALVVAATGDGVAYSRALLAIAELVVGPAVKTSLAASGPSGRDQNGDLLARVRRLLVPQPAVSGLARCGLIAAIVSLLVIASAAATLCSPALPASPHPVAPREPEDNVRKQTPPRAPSGSVARPIAPTSPPGNERTAPPAAKLPDGAALRFGSTKFATGAKLVRYLPDGKHLVVAVRAWRAWFQDVDAAARPAAVLSAETGEIVRHVGPAPNREHQWSVIAISGDGRRIAMTKELAPRSPMTWSYPSAGPLAVEIYDTASGKLLCALEGAPLSGASAMNHDGSRLVVAHRHPGPERKRRIGLWDAATGKLLKSTDVLNRHAIDSLAMDREGRTVALAGPGDVYFWDVPSNSMSVFEEHGATAVAFSLDGKFVGTGRGGAAETRLWNRATGDKLFQFEISGALVVAFTPDSQRYIAPSGYRHELEIRDVRQGRLIRKIKTHGIQIVDLSVSPDGKRLAVTGKYPGVGIWDLETGRPIAANGSVHDEAVRHIRFSPDGARVVTAGMDGRVAVWDAATGQLLRQLLPGSHDWAGVAEFSRDGRLVVSSSLDGHNRVWDAATGKEIVKLDGHGTTGARYSIAAPGGDRLVSFGVDGRLRVASITTGKALGEHTILAGRNGRSGEHDPSAISPDGSTLAISMKKRIDIYAVATGRLRRSIDVSGALPVALSADGRLLSTPFDLYDAESGEHLLDYGLNGGRAVDVAFSPDGRWVASATRGTAYSEVNHLWLVDTQANQTRRHVGPGVQPSAIAVSPHGKSVALACSDNSIFIYRSDRFAIVGAHSVGKVKGKQ